MLKVLVKGNLVRIYSNFNLRVNIILALFLLAIFPSFAKSNSDSSKYYNDYKKYEYMIPMRDGVRLYTAVYVPIFLSETYPILLYRTPYSVGSYGIKKENYKIKAPSDKFLKSKYIFVYQDIRGTYKSEGDFEILRPVREDKENSELTDETTDTYDTIDWLLKNIKGNNGLVGQWGISYSAWTTVMGMVDKHPALKASSPQASPADMFIGDDWHHNGAFRLMYAFWWMSLAAQERTAPTEKRPEVFNYEGNPWGYSFFLNAGPTNTLNDRYFDGKIPGWKDFIEHQNYDEYWRKQSVPQYLENITHPVLNVAGWFDSEDFYGPMTIYSEIERRNLKNKSTLVVGPWSHGGWYGSDGEGLGDINFGSKTSDWYKSNIVYPFFEYHLKGKGSWNDKEAIVFETGKNHWHSFNQWPPKTVKNKNIYLNDGFKLTFSKPVNSSGKSYDSYMSDPDNPVPFSNDIRTSPGHTWVIEDQRIASTRTDVLTYETEVLDKDITIAGPVEIEIFVSTTGTDSDFFVKLIDVFPGQEYPINDDDPGPKMGGYYMPVGVEVMRSRYRESFSSPEAMVPGEVTPIKFKIWDRFHTFKKGHKIMVQIHSSWFPAYDRNPQQFVDIYRANKQEYIKANQKVYRSDENLSRIVIPVLDHKHDHN